MTTKRKREKTRSPTPLQDDILRMSTDLIGPAVAVRIVAKKFAAAGIRLTVPEKRKLHQAITSGKADEFSIERRRKGASVMFTADDGEALTAEALRRVMAVFHRALKQSDSHAAHVLNALHNKWRSEYARQHREQAGFRRRLRKRWNHPFGLFHMFMTVYRESGEALANALIGTTADGRPLTARLVIELHARSCQVLYEIITLIEGGLADGAMSRCRTLHEIAVTAMFLQQGDEKLAARYVDHQVVESWKAVLKLVKYQGRISERPPSLKSQQTLKTRYDAVVAKYGKEFKDQYGWAAEQLKKERPSFVDIELAVNLDHLRPYYQLASHPVHANSKGLYFKLGALGRRGMLASATNHGFATPASTAVISAIQILCALMMLAPSLDAIVNIKLIKKLSHEVELAFVQTQRSEIRRFRDFDRSIRKSNRS
jgi:hypothetical protein